MNTVEPIRDLKKIEAMKKLLRGGNPRNEVLFILGINTALRISDLLTLTVGDVTDAKGKIRDEITVKEKKTGKVKSFPLNKAAKSALTEHLKRWPKVEASEVLFPSKKGLKPLGREQVWRIFNNAGKELGLEHIGTHTLRKTFGYHIYKKSGGNLGLVQKLLNHSSSGDTLRYIGIDREQMDNAYLELNL